MREKDNKIADLEKQVARLGESLRDSQKEQSAQGMEQQVDNMAEMLAQAYVMMTGARPDLRTLRRARASVLGQVEQISGPSIRVEEALQIAARTVASLGSRSAVSGAQRRWNLCAGSRHTSRYCLGTL